jgi:hypothetical protein
MPTFCRHNRFIERCPICSKTLPGASEPRRSQTSRRTGERVSSHRSARGPRAEQGLRVRHETRAVDDGYRSELVPGLRSSADAERLADELAFAHARLLALAADPPSLFGEIRAGAGADVEAATWACFLLVYFSPLEDEEPFAGIREAIAAIPPPPVVGSNGDREGAVPAGTDGDREGARWPGPADLEALPLGPRSSHAPGRGPSTLLAYAHWAARGGGSAAVAPDSAAAPQRAGQTVAFMGDPGWSAQRRFERVYERLALPGLSRAARYDLLVTLGRLGIYPLIPERLYLGVGRGPSEEDPTTAGAKRVFGIADAQLLERRAASLAVDAGVPIEALDLALANWVGPQRATLGVPVQAGDPAAGERARAALGL